MNGKPLIVVAMSGGVDSSAAAAMLVEQGYPVAGMMLRLWSEPGSEFDNKCCTPDAMGQARKVAGQLGIPFYAIDAREKFRGEVVEAFINGYRSGETPNPCMVCNRVVRWGFLLDHAIHLGAAAMATGHYARVERAADGQYQLLRGIDPNKDQSYVLSGLNQEQLSMSLFPLGTLTKPEVRAYAERLKLTSAQRPDSQDLCFLGNEDYRVFLSRYSPEVAKPGPIVLTNGEVIGEHQGLAFYTIGQRKGLGVAHAEPLYVLGKDVHQNRLVVGLGSQLGSYSLTAGQVNWISGIAPTASFEAEVKIRYKARPVLAHISPLGTDQFVASFSEPLRDITPGQIAVIYIGDRVVGSGKIQMESSKRED